MDQFYVKKYKQKFKETIIIEQTLLDLNRTEQNKIYIVTGNLENKQKGELHIKMVQLVPNLNSIPELATIKIKQKLLDLNRIEWNNVTGKLKKGGRAKRHASWLGRREIPA